jgi:2-succinyl-5-enolpyruvyl-6-hydroxy-3-cyclohexene-1-carboxylate synthase
MKKSINLNYLWSKFFVNQLALYGLKYVCISPGSRSTPLTTAFAENKRIKKFVIVDERSSAFFALGLAKQTGKPVALVTTSGTATANLYPAIIEAFKQRVPLIICTTDRPEYLRETGANQTINQKDLYKNHIRYSEDLALPKLSINSFTNLQRVVEKAFTTAIAKNVGPVHLNFQFEKPLEKSIDNIEVEDKFSKNLKELFSPPLPFSPTPILPLSVSTKKTDNTKEVLKKINSTQKGLIIVGWDSYQSSFTNKLIKLSQKTGYPILADGASGIFLRSENNNIIVNHQAFLRSAKFVNSYSPYLIIQFGNAPTSNTMLDFIKNSSCYKITVNAFGDRKDSGFPHHKILKANPNDFCDEVINILQKESDKSYLRIYQRADRVVEEFKAKFFKTLKPADEIGVVNQVIETLPEKSNLFISNSLPIRDLEFFKSKTNKKINLFVNRGASGIDGINSTAAGIAAASKQPTVLITGDLSFFHDTNGLHTIFKYKIPLTIILINNGGGAIFGMLPIAKEKRNFDDYFLTPLNLDFSKLIKTYKGKYYSIKSFNSLQTKLNESISNKSFSLLEIKTDYNRGIELRKKYFRDVLKIIEKEL